MLDYSSANFTPFAPFIHSSTTYLPAAKRVVVIGDIHGDLQRLVKCLYAANLINTKMEWIASPKETVLIQLGDQVDSLNRGNPEEWEKLPDTEVARFMENVANAAERGGGKVISMLGNHELMNVFGNFMYVSPSSLQKTGGQEGRSKLFRPGSELAANVLAKRPLVCKIGSLLFCHGGILPEHLYLTNGNLATINDIVQKVLMGGQMNSLEDIAFQRLINEVNGIVWTRFYHEASEAEAEPVIDKVLEMTQCKALFMGHTPHMHVTSKVNGKLWFCDTGISRAFGQNEYQILEIWDDGVPKPENNNGAIRVITIQEST